MRKIDSETINSNDILIKAYGKKLGLFKKDRVYIEIPFPISIFCGSEVELEYSRVKRMSLMQTSSDLSIFMAYDKENGKTTGQSIGLGNDLKSAIVYFENAVERVKSVNQDVEVHMAPGITKAITNHYKKQEEAKEKQKNK